VEGKDWRRIRDRLPNGYDWRIQEARRKSKKGRTIGGMILGIRKDLIVRDGEEVERVEGIMVGKVKGKKGILRVVEVYVNGDMERKLEEIREWLEGKEEGIKTVIGGDFNVRIEGRRICWEESMEDEIRSSRDRKINREGRILIDFIKERGWFIANGGIERDMEENWTYTGARGESVIDYVVVDDEMADEITRLEIGD